MRTIAKDHFLGKKGPRLNCARSVAEPFKDKFPLEGKTEMPLSACGGGMAPEGLCGAFYAAKCILESYFPERAKAVMEELRTAAGSLKCHEVKALRQLSCVDCVERSAAAIEKQ